jgi:hypothetical protein
MNNNKNNNKEDNHDDERIERNGGSSSLLSSGGSGKGMKKKVDVLDETQVVSGVASGSGDEEEVRASRAR